MKEQLISFKTAKLANEKGFKLGIGWHGFYDWFYDENGNQTANHRGNNLCCPTQSLLQKWLREEHNIFVSVGVNYCYKIYYNDELFEESTDYHSYEEALEKGLQEALKLIKYCNMITTQMSQP